MNKEDHCQQKNHKWPIEVEIKAAMTFQLISVKENKAMPNTHINAGESWRGGTCLRLGIGAALAEDQSSDTSMHGDSQPSATPSAGDLTSLWGLSWYCIHT